MINSISLSGFISDIEIKTSENGKKYIHFVLGCEYKANDIGFVHCFVFDNTVEAMEKARVKKGSRLVINGKLSFSHYENDKGKRLQKLAFVVDSFEITKFWVFDKKEDNEEGGVESED